MKKILFTFSMALGFFAANAQLSLTRSDFTGAPQKYRYNVDLNYELSNVKATGANQVWDFNNINTETEDVTIFHVASTTPDFSDFPNSDIALQMDSTEDMMYYILDGNDSIVVIGANDSTISNIRFRPLVFPLALNTTWTDQGRNILRGKGSDYGYPQADSVRLTLDYKFVNTADGEGKLKLNSEETDALKVRTINTITYKVEAKIGIWLPFLNDTEVDTSYSFYAENNGFSIVSMESRGDGTYRTKHKAIIKNLASVNNADKLKNVLQVYPNPATNFLNITFNGANTYKITDMIGREITKGNLTNSNIDISKMESGNYIIQVLNGNDVVGIQKFIKQ